jgi:hypothetical protein
MPTRAPAFSLSLRAAVTLSLAIGLLAPMPAVAAKGNDPRVVVAAEPAITAVSPGQELAFRATFVNDGPGTITHLRFEGSAPGAVFDRASAPCDGEGEDVWCELGMFKARTAVDLTIVFTAPADGEVGFAGSFAGDARSGNPNAASADVWSVTSSPIEINTDPGFFGSWQAAHAGLRTFKTIESGDQESTVTAHPVATDYAAMLAHSSAPIECTNPGDLGEVDLSGFGQAIDLSIADGGTAVDVKVKYDAHDVGIKPWHVRLVHQRDDGTCTLVPECDGSNDGNCFEAYYKGHGWHKQLVIRAELPHNGRIKGI